jgi:hypothetical protein
MHPQSVILLCSHKGGFKNIVFQTALIFKDKMITCPSFFSEMTAAENTAMPAVVNYSKMQRSSVQTMRILSCEAFSELQNCPVCNL